MRIKDLFNKFISHPVHRRAICLHRGLYTLTMSVKLQSYKFRLRMTPRSDPYHYVLLDMTGRMHMLLFENLKSWGDLDDVITYSRQGIRPVGHPYHPASLIELANAVWTRFKYLGNMEDLDEAITCYRQALKLCAAGPAGCWACYNLLAIVVMTRFLWLSRIEDLEEAITCYNQMVLLCIPSDPNHCDSLVNFGDALRSRFDQLRQIEDLDRAIESFRKALELCRLGEPRRSDILVKLGTVLSSHFAQSGKMEDLDEAIASLREALDLCSPNDSQRSDNFHVLADFLSNRFKQLGGMKDLDEAIIYYCQALELLSAGHPGRSVSLNVLANTLLIRFNQLGWMKDLADAITYYCQALELCPAGHPDRSVALNNLANAVQIRFRQLGRVDDLEEAITNHRLALDLRPTGHLDRSLSLNNLADALHSHFLHLGRIDDLEEAITCSRDALNLCPAGHFHRSDSLDHLANALHSRFEQLGKMDDLEEAITCNREALDLRPAGHPHCSHSLNHLADALHSRFQQLGKMVDLEEAITCDRKALDLCPAGFLIRSAALNNLGVRLRAGLEQPGAMDSLNQTNLFRNTQLDNLPAGHLASRTTMQIKRLGESGEMDELEDDPEETFTCRLELPSMCPADHLNHTSSLNSLGKTLRTRFQHSGRMEDLEEAITCQRAALVLCLASQPDRFMFLNSLANTLRIRFGQLRWSGDLIGAIISHREAVHLCPAGHPRRFSFLKNLANAVYTRFKEFGSMDDLEEAITNHHKALELVPAGSPDRASSLHNLANAVFTRFEQLGTMDNLEEAITYHHQALDLRPAGHPERYDSLYNLAIAIFARFEQLGSMDDLEEAIRHLSDAESALPVYHPRLVAIQSWLAVLYLKHYASDLKAEADLLHAFTLFERAANHTTDSSTDQFLVALQWASAARDRKHDSAIPAYSKALDLLARCLIMRSTIEYQQSFLSIVPQSLALDAASYAIEVGQLETAVEFLERGRTVVWSKLGNYRYPLERLRDVNGTLADEFEGLCGELEQLAVSLESGTLSASDLANIESGSVEGKTRRHRILSEKLDETLTKIRQIDGLEDFLQAVPFRTLQTAAKEGPVIIVNISVHRSDAIIIRSAHIPEVVPLPNAQYADMHSLHKNFLEATRQNPTDAKQITRILRCLWEWIVSPVVDRLRELSDTPEKSRIWWCPTSVLCALPLHAAGPYTSKSKNLPDIYISSYTPTLSSLIRARSGMTPGRTIPSPPTLLVMGQPDDPSLESSKMEIQEIVDIQGTQSLWDSVHVIVNDQATHEAVLGFLKTHSWAHFTCHGLLKPNLPFQSAFKLHDKELTLHDLVKAHLPDAEFAFLAACNSAAQGETRTPDEVIHLGAALQFCGFRSVVGTLWPMVDSDGPIVAKDFYTYLSRHRSEGDVVDFRYSAIALHKTTREMRKRKPPVAIDRWINFVHIGA